MHLSTTIAKRTIASLLLTALILTPALAFAAPSTNASGTTNPVTTPNPAPKTSTPATTTTAPKQQDTSSSIPAPLTAAEKAFRAELAKRQARLDALQAQLDALDSDLEIATEQFNAAEDNLSVTKRKLDFTEKDLQNAQAAYQVQMSGLEERIRVMYRGDDLDTIGLLLGSKSMSDFMDRIAFLDVVGQQDASLADTLGSQRDSIQQALLDLKDAKLKAEQLEFALKARRIEIKLRIQERQQMLMAAQSDLGALLGKQSGQRQTDEAALLKQILSGASSVGITVQKGSPVETALAYHGIPYVWAGADPSGFDCSGLILYVFAQHGVLLPHYSGSQAQLGVAVSPADLKPGDAVFFGSPIHHVGMYAGGDYFIEAPFTGSYVRVSKLSSRSDFACARRYPWALRTAPIWTSGSVASHVGSGVTIP